MFVEFKIYFSYFSNFTDNLYKKSEIMIIFFHYLANIFYEIYKKRLKSQSLLDFTISAISSPNHPLAEKSDENSIKFDPPLYKQRYERILHILCDPKWKDDLSKIVDFGCAEFSLFIFLKYTLPACNEILFVDIDELLLKDSLFKLYPLNGDFFSPRESPLTVKALAGSLALPDPVLENTDAVVGVEVIEHLYPDTLEALPFNVFHYIQPKLAIFTTPNSEFNIYFPQLWEKNKFRHADHKFEWDREQFQSWANNLTVRFPGYIVRFDGIGLGLTGAETEGCCSQLAVFIRKDIICDNYVIDTNVHCVCLNNSICSQMQTCSCVCKDCMPKLSHENSDAVSYYKLIAKIEYPVFVDSRTEDEKLLDELKYRIHSCGIPFGVFWNEELNRSEIPFGRIVNWTKSSKITITEEQLGHLVLKLDHKIEECMNHQTERTEKHIIYELEMASSEDNDASGYESDKCNSSIADDAHLSDWDSTETTQPWTLDDASAKNSLALEVVVTKKQTEALFDSGYQKSPSALDDFPAPLSSPSPLPGASHDKPNKLSNLLSVFNNFDQINELDVRRDNRFFNFSTNLPHKEMMRKICQEIVKNPIAGPSKEARRKPVKKASQSSDSEESADEAKSITTCLLENTLNKIDDGELKPDLIEALIEADVDGEENQFGAAEVIEEVGQIVENGDLANNNRDLEGNNYPQDQEQADEAFPVDNIVNNNEIEEPIRQVVQPAVEEEVEGAVAVVRAHVDECVIDVAWSSREALFDANSEVDLLEDFDMDGIGIEVNGILFPNDAVIIPNNDHVMPVEENGFPIWMLQIFEESDAIELEDDLHDEPHFYCQGDGLGVHPSTVDMDDDDDDDDEGNETDSDSSSSDSDEFVNAEAEVNPENLNDFGDVEGDENNFNLFGQPILPPHVAVDNVPEDYVNGEDADL